MTRSLWIGLGVILLAIAMFLPTGWYDELPVSREDLPDPPIRGVTLVRLCFGVEGLVALWMAFKRRRAATEPPCPIEISPPTGHDLRHAGVWLGAITFLAAALRLIHLDSDLWLDEITTVLDYRGMSPFHLLTAYTSSNNHLLNTLLIKASIGSLGLSEVAIRLPAVVFGILGVPAQYLLARIALRGREAMVAAFLLAVSYHHLFFSQNGRGYTAYFLWTSLATYFFLRLLTRNEKRDWALYVVTMFLCLASVLYGWLVLAGHGAVLLGVWIWQAGKHRPVAALVKRLLGAQALVGLLGFHLNASIIPQVWSYVSHVYTTQTTGYSAFSVEFYSELKRGIVAGFGPFLMVGILAGAAVLATFGYCLIRRPIYWLTLISPLVVTGCVLLGGGLQFSPRFFLWALPVAFIGIPVAAEALGSKLTTETNRPRGALRSLGENTSLLAALGFGLLSAASYPYYYTTPKQPTRASLEWVVDQMSPGDTLVTAYLAEWGPRFYAPSMGLEEGRSFLVARSLETLVTIEEERSDHPLFLLTTFHRAVSRDRTDLWEHILENYREIKTFPATIGNGEVTVWRFEPVVPSSS